MSSPQINSLPAQFSLVCAAKDPHLPQLTLELAPLRLKLPSVEVLGICLFGGNAHGEYQFLREEIRPKKPSSRPLRQTHRNWLDFMVLPVRNSSEGQACATSTPAF